jgi:muramoyltetrapeptide carboxypeptidase
LRLASVLDKVAGVVAGNFNCQKAKDANEIERVLRDYFAALKVPVVINFPVGHIADNATLPYGAFVELDGDGTVLRLLENPVEL